MKKKLIVFFSLVFVISGYSQEAPQTFSLNQAIDFALENNRNAKNAKRDIEAAYKQKWETIAIGLPQLNANIEYQNFIKQPVSLLPGEIAGGEPGTFVPITFGTKQNLNASATVTQKIFDGTYIVGLQSTKVFLEISKNAAIKTDLEVRKAIINAYGNTLVTEEGEKILIENRNTLRKNLDELTKIYENGLEEEESVEQLKITLSDIESALNNYTRLKKVSYQMLNMTLGLDIDHPIILTDNLETLTAQNVDLHLINDPYSVENTIDYQIAENNKESKELLVKLEQSKALPALSAFLNGGYTGNSNTFTFTNRDQIWFGSSLFGVNLSIPIFSSGMRGASTQRAKINLEKSIDDLMETEQRIKLDVATARSAYQFALEDYSNKKENLDLAKRIEAKNETKFFEGIASSFDLRQAQIQLYTAQQDFLKAMLDVITRKAELETLLNTVNQ
ncbi:TolC family protein [Tamlana fucoidanivorans]|uniref:TolC family protein n=1 Tax=Allotamlana fucoidanivorans TaxID=2583814 RepID=A0A5C4SKZ9_9FLAO|nr:TolC family protein [Tamlana fucoidanivorans]TNJ44261.1 TolC family protein [Tamlana fucoidanivorans]